jgi:hypothetical protein
VARALFTEDSDFYLAPILIHIDGEIVELINQFLEILGLDLR